MNEFEKKLEQQAQRQIPAGWREEILAAARTAQAAPAAAREGDRSLLATLRSQLSALLWPHPKAWAGLAAVWVGIVALNFSTRENAPQMVGKSTPISPEMVVELQKQQKLYAELINVGEAHVADRPKGLPGRPRTQRAEILAG